MAEQFWHAFIPLFVAFDSIGLLRRLGRSGADVVSKISSLILTAFGVMFVRRGVLEIIAGR